MDSYSNQHATYSTEEIIPESSEETAYASFSEFFKEKVLCFSEKEGRTVKTREIACILGIGYEQFRKYITANKRKTTKRDCIIAICAVIGCDATGTNEALRLYGFPELDQYQRRDEIIWDNPAVSLVHEFRKKPLVIINLGLTPLDDRADIRIYDQIGKVFSAL